VLAPGEIAAAFTHTLHINTDQRVVAVASRSKDRAATFGRDFGISKTYGSYEQLADDREVDIVYISAPHSEHSKLALPAISAGHNVLDEKPFTVTADEACDIVRAARKAGVFAMEAMWTRYLPQTDIIRQLLADVAAIETMTTRVRSPVTQAWCAKQPSPKMRLSRQIAKGPKSQGPPHGHAIHLRDRR
jgi:predicted dehydrogenase